MSFKQKLINRHKNPIGLILRVINYITIAYALWRHNLNLILFLIFVDFLNWFFMPEVKPEHKFKIINQIVQKEIDWIKSPWTLTKKISFFLGISLFICLGIGLWKHNYILLSTSFILMAILKQIILKMFKRKNS